MKYLLSNGSKIGLVSSVLALGLVACAPRPAFPTASPLPTITPVPPTLTPIPPTPTSPPTPTLPPTQPPPTATPQPTPTPVVIGIFKDVYYQNAGRLGAPLPGWTSDKSYPPSTFAELAMTGGHMFAMLGSGLHSVVVTFGSKPGAALTRGRWAEYTSNSSVGYGQFGCPQSVERQPTGWFGDIWCKKGIGTVLGNYCAGAIVRDIDQETHGNVHIYRLQKFEKGFIFRDSDGWTHGRAYSIFQRRQLV